MEYVWVAVVVAAIVFEALTTELVAIWCLPAALISLLLAVFQLPPVAQIVAFVLITLLCVIFARPFFAHRSHVVATNVDALIGERVVVTESIDNLAGRGQVKLTRNNQGWSARSMSDDICYEEGEILRVVAIEGVKLICQK